MGMTTDLSSIQSQQPQGVDTSTTHTSTADKTKVKESTGLVGYLGVDGVPWGWWVPVLVHASTFEFVGSIFVYDGILLHMIHNGLARSH